MLRLKVGDWPSTSRVAPFGYLRINSCLQIPGAFRSLPRPSSLPEAKASSVRSSSLSRTFQVNSLRHLRLNFYSFAFEIAVLNFRNSKKLEFVTLITDYNLFNFFTSLSLSVLSMISQIPPQKYPSSEGTAKVHTFFELTNLFGKFFKKIDPGSPPGMRDGSSSPTRSGISWPRYRPLSSQPPAKLPGVDSFSPKIGSTLPN